MEPIDLNRPAGDIHPEQHDHGCVNANVEVVFRNHRKRLLRLFQEAREEGLVCLGAVAWLTDFEVLDAMATLPSSVVVQKEDFLRPDSPTGAGGQRDGWRDVLREHYTAVAESARHDPGFCRYNFPPPLGDMSLLGDHTIAGVRCVGVRNARGAGGNRQQPLMHHKYLVFAKLTFPLAPGHEGKEDPLAEPLWTPRIVWTGSCNLTRLAQRSRENAVILRDPVIATAYLHEWTGLMALSEPLDWDSEWVAPQWHEGT